MTRAFLILPALLAGFAVPLLPSILVPAQAQVTEEEGIVATVNDHAITTSNLGDRLQLVISSSGLPDNADIRAKLAPQILTMLIEEQLKLQEAEKSKLEVSDDEIDQGFAMIAQQNGMTADQFRMLLRRSGVREKTLDDQIRSQIAWTKVVQYRLRPQIELSEKDVEAMRQRLEASKGKQEYHIFEIFLPVNNARDDKEMRALAQRLFSEISQGKVPFQRVAAQFSQSAGATKGGDMGWVQEGQLAEELDQKLAKLGEGALGEPVRSPSGYHILYLMQKRMLTDETMPDRKAIEQTLGSERLDRLQRRYLQDMTTSAFIERRI